jgi:hypothetical protein
VIATCPLTKAAEVALAYPEDGRVASKHTNLWVCCEVPGRLRRKLRFDSPDIVVAICRVTFSMTCPGIPDMRLPIRGACLTSILRMSTSESALFSMNKTQLRIVRYAVSGY